MDFKRFIVFLFCYVVILFFKNIRVFFPLTQSLFLVIVTTLLSFYSIQSRFAWKFWADFESTRYCCVCASQSLLQENFTY